MNTCWHIINATKAPLCHILEKSTVRLANKLNSMLISIFKLLVTLNYDIDK